MKILPVSPNYNHTFNSTIGTEIYKFEVLFNTRIGIPTLSISIAGDYIIRGLLLVSGTNLLSQFNTQLNDMRTQNIDDVLGEINIKQIGQTSFVFFPTL